MGITATSGPSLSFGQALNFESNPDAGPDVHYQGDMIIDPRTAYTYQPGQPPTAASVRGWLSSSAIPIIDQVPSTLSATNISNTAGVTAGTPLTLASTSVSGVTVGCSIISASTGQVVTGLLGLDVNVTRTATATFTNGSPKITWSAASAPGLNGIQVGDTLTFTSTGTLPTNFALLTTYYVVAVGALTFMVSATAGGTPISAGSAGSGTQTASLVIPATNTYPPVAFGQGGAGTGGALAAWNPAWSLSRAVVVTSNGDDTGGFYTVNGYDIYNYPMSQKLTGVNTSTATTTKAFKYISSIVPTGTLNSTTLTVGTADVFGLPLRVDFQPYVTVYWGTPPAALIAVASVTFVAADILTATSTTGDVRGTVYGGSASNNVRRLMVFWTPQVANMNSTVGLLGQTQA